MKKVKPAQFNTNMDTNMEIESMDYIMKRSLLAKNKLAFILTDPDGLVRFCCVECTAKYDKKEELEKHLLIHNKEYRFLCEICGTGLKRKEHLDRHTMEHQEMRPYVCHQCGKGFKRKEHLNIHKSIHSGDKSESCPICNKSFYRRDHLRKHLQTHSKAFLERRSQVNDKGYLDIKEEPVVVMEEDINEEILNEAIAVEDSPLVPNSSRPFACVICGKAYKRKDHLKIHSWTHKKKEHACSECGKAFHREDQLLSHMNIHLQSYSMVHNDEDYILPEEQYDHSKAETFATDNGLLVARVPIIEQVEDKNEFRPHECEICHRRFKRRQHLKVHMNTHAKEQPTIWCSMCGQGFALNRDFESHECNGEEGIKEEDSNEQYSEDQVEEMQSTSQEITQDAKKENKYPQEFVDVSVLAHMDDPNYKQYTEEKEIPMPLRVYVCKFCNKPFKRKDHYKIHLHIHTGIKSFFCPDCGKGFYRKDHLQKHVLVHMKVRQPPRKEIPDLFPIQMIPKKKVQPEVKPEITIHAPSNTKLRVPLQIKVPYQVVMSMDNGEQRAVTIDPQAAQNSS